MASVDQKGEANVGEKFNAENEANFGEKFNAEKNVKRPLWYVFGGMASQWQGMAKSLMPLDPFALSIQTSHETLKDKFNFDLLNVVVGDEDIDQVVNAFVGITAVQIALVDVLRYLNIEPDGIIGHSIGEVACAYADGCLTADQALAVAYVRGRCLANAGLDEGVMVAVKLSREEALKRCPSGVTIACDNGPDSVTVAGPRKQIDELMEQLKKEDVFNIEVPSCGFAFHSTAMTGIDRILRSELSKLALPNIKRKKWISTSFSPPDWNTHECLYCGVNYFSEDLIRPVYFRQAVEKIPKNAVVVDISPHSLMAGLVKRSLGNEANSVTLMLSDEDCMPLLLKGIGELSAMGFNPDIEKIYAKK